MGYLDNNGLLYFWTKLKTLFVRKVNNQTPDANGNITVAVPGAATERPLTDYGSGEVGTSTKYAREDHKHPTDTSRASASHSHGNITNAGVLQTTDITIGSGDKLVVTDSSNSNKVSRASASFDGSTTTQALSKKGTWVDIPQAATTNPSMDGTASPGSSAKFAKEDHVHPSDTTKQDVLTFDNTPTAGSSNPVTSGGILDAIEGAMGDVVSEIPSASTTTPLMDGTASIGQANKGWATGNHVHPTDTSRAPLASPEFTGSPKAPNPSSSASGTEIATAKWVRDYVANKGIGTSTFKGVVNAYTDITNNLHYIEKGWYWVVGTAGTYAGQDCEQGDFIYAVETHVYGTRTVNGTAYAYGDANMDGSITLGDAALIGRCIEGLYTPTTDQEALGDVDGDGSLTNADVNIITSMVNHSMQYVASVPNSSFAIVQTNITPMTNSEIDTIVAS